MAASSSPPLNHDQIPFSSPQPVTVASLGGGTGGSSRRLPPPCWTHDETVALLDCYRDKWYSLRRGNLRQNHWQEVAEDLAIRSPSSPPKTSMQCRHKMEKLRKRYRTEIKRAASYGEGINRKYCSTWIHFNRIDSMERGQGEGEDYHKDLKQNTDLYNQNMNSNSNIRNSFPGTDISNGGAGIRIRIPTLMPVAKPYSEIDEMLSEFTNPNPNHSSSRLSKGEGAVNPNYSSSRLSRGDYSSSRLSRGEGGLGKRVVEEVGEKRKGDPIGEAVTAIKMLGEGLVRMENMKMDVARELEQMRMDMEMKKTEMILESQQRIVDAFAKAYSERNAKKAKRMPTPESNVNKGF